MRLGHSRLERQLRGTTRRILALVWAVLSLLGVGERACAGHYVQQYGANPPWPGGKVYYSFDPSVTNRIRGPYLEAIREWELAGNVKFIPRTNESHFLMLNFDRSAFGSSLTLGQVPVLTVNTLERWQLCHQLGHSLGLAHENYRTDRDIYITILTNNLQPGILAVLGDILTAGVKVGPYDFDSVMHPVRSDGSLLPGYLDSLQVKTPYEKYQPRMGGRAALSDGDRAAIAGLYGAATGLSSVVSHGGDTGPGSLRAAIYYANDHPGTRITFNIAVNDVNFTNGVFWIRPSGQLPLVTGLGTEIDATTQPGFAGSPIVALDGSAMQPEVGSVTGLGFMSGKGVVRGLSVGRFSGGGIGFLFSDATNNAVEGCYVGIDPSGTNRVANTGAGVSLFLGAANNVIGGTNITQRNVISGNNEGGIVIRGTNSSGNRVIGNLIGLDASGTASIASTQNGVEIIDGATANLVGGTLLGERNIISGNGASAVLIAGDGAASNIVQGNFIGLDVTGTNAVPNSGAGIGLSDGAVGNLVGGTAPGAGNIIVGSQSYGIAAASATTAFNTIQGNWIGVDATGYRAVPNGTGVAIFLGAHDNLIGGATSGAGNVISGSLDAGLSLTGTNTTSNTIQGNRIGTSSDGLAAIPNQGDGILIHGSASGNAIGGTSSGAGNLISGNRTSGISMEDAYTLNNTVQGNLIGLDITGTNLLGNASVGVGLLSGSASNLVGGSVVGARNIIAGSGSFGIAIVSADTTANVIQGNWIGVDATGAKAAPNGYGVTLFSGAHDNLIGGSNAGEGNVISGNTQLGVGIDGATTANNILQGNKIGTDASGTVAVANQSDGILVRSGARQNLIGGVAAGAGNLISGNGGSGVVVNGTNTTQNLIQGNLIGTDLSGTSKLANAIVNVWIRSDAYENVVGLDKTGAGRGNRIGYGQAGVVVDGDLALGNTIRGNAMPHNGGPSIFLTSDTVEGSAPLDNDDLDPDSGPNRLQNYPVLGTVSLSNGLFSISGTFNSTPNREYFLDFYRNTSTNGSTYGDAEEYVGSLRVTTGVDGNVAPFTYTVASSTDLDRFTATATDVTTGDTSELSPVAVRLLPTLFSGPYSFTATRKLRFNLDLNMGQTYRIQATTNLAAPEWLDVQTVNASSAGLREVDVPAGTNAVQEFYRVVSP